MTGYLLGAPPGMRPAIIWALTDQGFPRPTADAWANAWTFIPEPGLVLVEATCFDDHGIPLEEALLWNLHGFFAAEATCFYDAKYTPSQAATVRDLVEYEFEVDDWLATGMPAERVIAYLRAEVEIDEMPAFEAASGGPMGPLSTLAALLG